MRHPDIRFKSIRKKLFHTYGLLMISLIVIFFGLNIFITTQLKTRGIDNLIEISIEGVFRNIESLIKNSVNQYLVYENEKLIILAESYYDFATEGYISEDEAKTKILDIISSGKVGKSGYTYVINYDGIMIEHPVKDYIGKDYSSAQIMEMEEGFIEYRHENPGDTGKLNKILYMSRFKPWEWIFSTTVYESDPIITSLRLEEIEEFINTKKLSNIDCISILNSDCEFLIPPDKRNLLANQLRVALKPMLPELKEADTGRITIPLTSENNGKFRAIIFFKYIPVLDWMIIGAGTPKELYAPVINAYMMQSIAIVISIILLIFFNSLLAKRFTAPLKELVRILDLNSGGILSRKAEIKTGDEFETLGNHFNNFLDSQQRYIEDISEAQTAIRILAKFPDENPDPVIRLSKTGKIEYANKRAEEDILEINNLKTGDNIPDDLMIALTSCKALTGRNEYSTGKSLYSFTTTAVSEQEGSYLFGRDITRQKKFESLQLLSENIFQNSIEGIVITDGDGVIESVNPAFTQITGFSEEDAIGENPRILKSYRHSGKFYETMWNQLLEKGYWEGEIWNRKKNGDVYPEFLTITSVRDESENIKQFISFFHDLSDVKEKEEKIEYEATHDQLTGLPNRKFLLSNLKDLILKAVQRNQNIAVVYMDIINLKRINESLGPESGDNVLIGVSERLTGLVEPPDIVVSVGSDEFVFVFNNISKEDISYKIDDISNAFTPPFVIKGRDVHIDVNLGISLCPGDSTEPMDLVANAEAAMTATKKDINNNFTFYSPVFKREGLSRLEIETGLKAAFENGNFYLNYQPKVSVETGRIVGAEALVRVGPIEGQFIGPDVFIPVAEEIGLIEPLGAWVLERACEDTRSLIDAGYKDFNVAVNLSPWQFRKSELPEMVSNIIDHVNIPPENLNLEITESMAIANVEDSIKMMHRLTDIGLILSIDDFGTGYSSLSYLSQFPVNILKIDKVFVVGIPDDPKKVGVVQAILSLANNLGMETVAEGVETEEHFKFLKERGCQQIQGFYFFRPMPINEIKEILARG